jgi:uncharacterized OsmC-like protein
MSDTAAVQAIYLEREMLRLEFAKSSIVLDHAAATGGGAKGPSPGNIMNSGMLAASLFHAMDNAKALGVRLNSLVARCSTKAVREGKEGPLHALAYLARIWRNLELEGDFDDVDAERIAGRAGLLETLRNGLELTERVTFSDGDQPRRLAAKRNPAFLEYEKQVDGLAPGAILDDRKPAEAWHLSATPLDYDTVMVEVPGLPLIVSRTGEEKRGPAPHELLLGGLAGCTAIYVGRNTPVHDIPLERVEVTAVAATPQDLTTPIRAIDKVTHIIGRLTDDEREKCKFFADFCALGETLKRGAKIIENVETRNVSQVRDSISPFAFLAQSSQPPADCDDGSCCVPQTQPAAA